VIGKIAAHFRTFHYRGVVFIGRQHVVRRGFEGMIILNSDLGCCLPSITQSALKILWRQCSELACANMYSSMSFGLRPSLVNASCR
jgi:hypothetical protein